MSARVLVVDDEVDIRAFLEVTLELGGYEVLLAADGVEALELARTGQPDVVVLDVMMPRLDGREVLQRLRSDVRTSDLPVILLTALGRRHHRIEGLDAGADDYITKPFEADELLARIRALLRRSDRQRARNPLTGLPGNEAILSELSRRLDVAQPFALLYVDLDQFKPFNDYYGFLRGDEALRAVAELLVEVQEELLDETGFVGHVGGDDFVLLVAPEDAADVAQAVCDRFDELAPSLYDPADREAGYIEVPDRRGVPQRYGIVALSVGIASTDRRPFAHHGEVVTVATEMKRYVKSLPGRTGSTYAVDRRLEGRAPVDLEVELPDLGADVDLSGASDTP